MSDPTLYLYTSLTAGSSHIVTATARIETILKANKLPFRAVDVATDDAARKLWGRRSKGKKLPGLVKYGDIVGVCDHPLAWKTAPSSPNSTTNPQTTGPRTNRRMERIRRAPSGSPQRPGPGWNASNQQPNPRRDRYQDRA